MALPSVLGTSQYMFLKHSSTLSDVPWNPLLRDLQAGSPLPATLVHGISNCSSKPPESNTGVAGWLRGVCMVWHLVLTLHWCLLKHADPLCLCRPCWSQQLCITMYCNTIEKLTVHLSSIPEHQHAFFVKVERRWFPIFSLPSPTTSSCPFH